MTYSKNTTLNSKFNLGFNNLDFIETLKNLKKRNRQASLDIKREANLINKNINEWSSEFSISNIIDGLLNEAVVEITIEGVICNISSSFTNMLEYTDIEVVGSYIQDIIGINIEDQYNTIVHTRTRSKIPLILSINVSCSKDKAIVVIRNITNEHKYEEQIVRQNEILKAVSYAARKFLIDDFDTALSKVVKRLMVSTKTSRAYLYLYDKLTKKFLLRIEECRQGVTNSKLDEVSFECDYCLDKLFNYEILIFNESVLNANNGCNKISSSCIRPDEVKSSIMVPIFMKKSLYGFIGFEDIKTNKLWMNSEIEALNSAASILSSAIQRNIIKDFYNKEKSKFNSVVKALDHSSDPILLLNKNKRIEFVNKIFEKEFNLKYEDIYNKSICNIFDLRNSKILNEEWEGELTVNNNIINVKTIPIRNGGNKIKYYLVIRK